MDLANSIMLFELRSLFATFACSNIPVSLSQNCSLFEEERVAIHLDKFIVLYGKLYNQRNKTKTNKFLTTF